MFVTNSFLTHELKAQKAKCQARGFFFLLNSSMGFSCLTPRLSLTGFKVDGFWFMKKQLEIT